MVIAEIETGCVSIEVLPTKTFSDKSIDNNSVVLGLKEMTLA